MYAPWPDDFKGFSLCCVLWVISVKVIIFCSKESCATLTLLINVPLIKGILFVQPRINPLPPTRCCFIISVKAAVPSHAFTM